MTKDTREPSFFTKHPHMLALVAAAINGVFRALTNMLLKRIDWV